MSRQGRAVLTRSERTALEIAANYTTHREVNEQAVSRYQAVSHAVADKTTKFDAADLTEYPRRADSRRGGRFGGRMGGFHGQVVGNDTAFEIDSVYWHRTTPPSPVERIQRDSGRADSSEAPRTS